MNLTAALGLACLCLAITGCSAMDQDACQWSGYDPGVCGERGMNPTADAIINGMQRRQLEEQQRPREQLTYQPNPFRI